MTQKFFKNEDETVLMVEIKGSKEEINSLYKSLSSSVINVLNLKTEEEDSYEDKSVSCENDDPDFNPFIGKEKESEKETKSSEKDDDDEDVDMSIFS